MSSEIRSRLIVLSALALLGVALAGVGTSLGMGSSLTNHGDDPSFVVTNENITFSKSGDNVTLIDNMSNVKEVRIDQTGSNQYQVRTEAEQSLTATERERARQIARSNQTVQQHLDSLSEYELGVDPIHEIDSDSMSVVSVDLNESKDDGEYDFVAVSQENENRSVVVERDPEYVADRAVVRVRQPSDPKHEGLKYSVKVDLANETVTGITDWDEIREDSSQGTVSHRY
ncbi:hypothetical protein [Halostella sp. PRR32]|uniref:hypothetical protein n=1 Tax=Halostella sp. PRR32 TaxID=3098147 RepID=UPI002B1D5723|nr:hypothetical protein [Halostella sp. PRR32]